MPTASRVHAFPFRTQRRAITEEEWVVQDDSFQDVRQDFLSWITGLVQEGLVSFRIGSSELLVDMTKAEKPRMFRRCLTDCFLTLQDFEILVARNG